MHAPPIQKGVHANCKYASEQPVFTFCAQHMALAQDKLTAHCSSPRPPPQNLNIARKSSSPPRCPRSPPWTSQASHPCCFLRICVGWVLPRFMLLCFGSVELFIFFRSNLLVLLWLPDLDLVFDIVAGANHTTGTCSSFISSLPCSNTLCIISTTAYRHIWHCGCRQPSNNSA